MKTCCALGAKGGLLALLALAATLAATPLEAPIGPELLPIRLPVRLPTLLARVVEVRMVPGRPGRVRAVTAASLAIRSFCGMQKGP